SINKNNEFQSSEPKSNHVDIEDELNSKLDQAEEIEKTPKEDTFTNIRIAAAGDIMFHETQLMSAYDAESNTYDFKSVFEDVKPIFNEADLALANFESTTAGSTLNYRGYPSFNSPDETIDAIKYAGIDVLTTAN